MIEDKHVVLPNTPASSNEDGGHRPPPPDEGSGASSGARAKDGTPVTEFQAYSPEGVLQDEHVVLPQKPPIARRRSLKEAVENFAKQVTDVERKAAQKKRGNTLDVADDKD